MNRVCLSTTVFLLLAAFTSAAKGQLAKDPREVYRQKAQSSPSSEDAKLTEEDLGELLELLGEAPVDVNTAPVLSPAPPVRAPRQESAANPVGKLSSYEVGRLTGHTDSVVSLAFAGKTLVSAAKDGFVKMWDAESRRLIRSIDARKMKLGLKSGLPSIEQMVVSPSGGLIAVLDNKACWIITVDGKPKQAEFADAGPQQVTILDCRFLGESAVLLARETTHRGLVAETVDVYRLGLGRLADAEVLFKLRAPDEEDLKKVPSARELPFRNLLTKLAVSPSGRLLAAAAVNHDPRLPKRVSDVELWNLNTKEPLFEVFFKFARIPRVGSGEFVYKYQLKKTSPAGKEYLQNGFVYHETACFSPNEKTLLAGHKLWNLATGKYRARLPSDTLISDAAFSPDGAWLVTAGRVKRETAVERDGKSTTNVDAFEALQIWDTLTGKMLSEVRLAERDALPVYDSTPISPSVAVSADAKLIATAQGGNSIRFGMLRSFSKPAGTPRLRPCRSNRNGCSIRRLPGTLGSLAAHGLHRPYRTCWSRAAPDIKPH